MQSCKKWVAVALIALLVPVLGFGQQHQPKLIDVHEEYNAEPGFLHQILIKLREHDGMAIIQATPKAYSKTEAYIHKYPNRFIGFCDLNLDAPDILEQVDQCHAIGFRGLGELGPSLHNYDSQVYWPIYRRAQKYHMILLFHTGVYARENPEKPHNVSFDRMRVTRLDLIARMFPGLIIIGAHMGNPDYAEAAEIGRWNPNLYYDLSGSTLVKLRNNYPYFKSLLWWTGAGGQNTPKSSASAFEKIVFGSDAFGGDSAEFDRALSRYHKMLDACDVPKNVQAMIFSGTMWKILQKQKAEMASSSGASQNHSTSNAQ